MFSYAKKVDQNLVLKDLPRINDLKKTALFFGAFLSIYLVFKTVVLMNIVGYSIRILHHRITALS